VAILTESTKLTVTSDSVDAFTIRRHGNERGRPPSSIVFPVALVFRAARWQPICVYLGSTSERLVQSDQLNPFPMNWAGSSLALAALLPPAFISHHANAACVVCESPFHRRIIGAKSAAVSLS
jgi:hypothetical protein